MKLDAGNIESEVAKSFKYLLYSRALRSVALIYASLAFSLYLHALRFSVELIGLVAALVFLVGIILSLLYGMLGDRKGFRTELIVAEIVTALGALLIAISANPILIILGILLAGLSGGAGSMRGAFSPGANAYVAHNFRNEAERVKRFSMLSLVASLSSIGGSALFMFVSPLSLAYGEINAYRMLFFISFLLLFASIFSLARLKELPKSPKKSAIVNPQSWRYLRKVIVVNAINGVGIGMIVPLLPLWFKLTYHVSSVEIGWLFTLSYIATALGLFLSMKYAVKIESLKVTVYTRIASALLVVAFALSPLFILSAVFYNIRALISGFGSPSRTNVNIRGVSDEDYGTGSSIQGIATRVAQLSSGASGYLMEIYLPMPLLLGGILQLLAGLGYSFMFKSKH